MTPRPRFITKPGCTCVCKDCGSALVLACPKGHEPAEYILSVDEQDAAARAHAPRPKRIMRKPRPNPNRAPRISTCGKCQGEFKQAWTGKPARDCRPCRGLTP